MEALGLIHVAAVSLHTCMTAMCKDWNDHVASRGQILLQIFSQQRTLQQDSPCTGGAGSCSDTSKGFVSVAS